MFDRVTYINIARLYTLKGGVRIKEALDDCAIIQDAYMTVVGDKVAAVGKMDDLKLTGEEVIDLDGKIVIPGLIDAHSHLVFYGDRTNEYALKIKGASYMDIYALGGGIHATVRATRAASFKELYDKARATLEVFMHHGVTTIEAKSGYGLDKCTELRQLRVAKKIDEDLPIDIVKTFMPGHALYKDYKNAKEYFDMIITDVLPIVVKEDLAEYMDCFLEKGVFDVDESRYILEAGKRSGLKIKIHVDEIEDIGGVDLGVELAATSLEHLMVTDETNMDKMKEAGITAVILPATSFNLRKPFANVQKMKEKGLIIALSCDYNPGSSPCNDPILMARIASRGLSLTPNEVLSMMTINSAKALDREGIIGSLEPHKQADFVIMDARSFDEVIADLGQDHVEAVYKKGVRVC